MAKRRVALFGGGFNPIAMQHQRISQTIWQTLDMPTWFMPCYNHRFAKDDELASPDDRWNMMVRVTDQFDYTEACDWEMRCQHDGSTWESLEGLRKDWSDTEFYPVIGMDNANLMLKPLDQDGWKNGELLIQTYPFIVLQRAGEEPQCNWFQQAPHYLLPFNYRISSTDIRNAIKRGDYEFARQHLNLQVWEYIVANKLYGYT